MNRRSRHTAIRRSPGQRGNVLEWRVQRTASSEIPYALPVTLRIRGGIGESALVQWNLLLTSLRRRMRHAP